MKTFLAIILTLIASTAVAGLLMKDSNGNLIQGAAPNGAKITLLTVASTTVDMTDDVWWNLYAGTACKYRIMDTTDRTGHLQQTAPVNVSTSRIVNKNSPFINFSGCTNGELQRQ